MERNSNASFWGAFSEHSQTLHTMENQKPICILFAVVVRRAFVLRTCQMPLSMIVTGCRRFTAAWVATIVTKVSFCLHCSCPSETMFAVHLCLVQLHTRSRRVISCNYAPHDAFAFMCLKFDMIWGSLGLATHLICSTVEPTYLIVKLIGVIYVCFCCSRCLHRIMCQWAFQAQSSQ